MGAKAMSSMAKMKGVKSALVGIIKVRRWNGPITTARYSQWTHINGYQVHHIIPQALMDKSIGKALSKARFDIHSGDNLRYLEDVFHTRHDAYTDFVEDKLQGILSKNGGALTISDINGVINDMHNLINQAEGAFKTSGTTLNNFFK
jgi:hypothetical protein